MQAHTLRAALAGLALTLGAAATPATAAVFTNAPSDAGTIFSFGAPDTTSYGQVFLAPGGTLQSWTFSLDAANTGGFKLVVADWNGSQAVGPALYESAVMNGVPGGIQAYTFSGINLGLTAGDDYIAYITVAGVGSPLGGSGVAGSSGDGGLGGGFRFLNSNGTDPLTLNNPWSNWSVPNMTFTAEFGEVQIPEPGSLALLGLALAGLVATRRRAAA
ncbi:MAG: PEP-CTERM sorting domain-containing protein [Acetobacteraceae bacterium]|nr:PEP-CTERM sorting domain-containing protein [Acetobacteraceae bacterium]